MRLALPPPQLIPTTKTTGNVRRKSLGRRESVPRMTGSVTANGTVSATRKERGSVSGKTARRAEAEAGARGRGITNVVAPLRLQAMRDVIMVAKVGKGPRGIIQSTITKPILQVNNGQKMPPKLKIHLKTISLPQLL